MNDIAKQRICDKFFEALKKEGLNQSYGARIFKVDPSYISSMKKSMHWRFVPEKAWESFLKWVNSGLSLRQYEGKIKMESIKSQVKKEPKSNISLSQETNTTKIKSSVNLIEIDWILRLARMGKNVEEISKELGIYIEIVKSIVLQKRIETPQKEEESVTDTAKATKLLSDTVFYDKENDQVDDDKSREQVRPSLVQELLIRKDNLLDELIEACSLLKKYKKANN